MKHLQTFRFDKQESKVLEEGIILHYVHMAAQESGHKIFYYVLGFLIPGVSLNGLLVITSSDESGIISGQAKFSLKDRGSNTLGGFHIKEKLTFGDSGKITVSIIICRI